jgi:PPE-repeat protein
MDFGIYPPEINSGRMYTGPGSGPMMAAAQAWGSLADELYTAASGYQSVVSELTDGVWSGPSSAAMGAAAASYVEWLGATAAQAEETAAQARAAAAGYEAAFAMTVPPPEIAANRSLLAVLVATNFLGQNTPAIAATETLYAEMWAQDALAMYGYAGSSAAATLLTPFTSPHQNTDPGGTASQAAAVSQASGTAAGNVQGTISTVPQALSAATAPAQTDPLSTLSNLISVFLSAPTDLVTLFGIIPADALSGPVDFPIAYLGTISGQNTDNIVSGWKGTEPWPGRGPTPLEPFPATLQNLPPGAVPAPTMSAALGEANMVGGLSVPSNWTVAAPEIRSVAMASPLTGASPTAVAAPLEAGSATSFNQMGLAGMAGQAMAGPPATDAPQDSGKPVTHARLAARGPGATGDDEPEATPAPRTVVTGVAAAIREITKLRNEGRLTEEEYKKQKKHLLGISVRHRPLG